jgi:hypothetical protein
MIVSLTDITGKKLVRETDQKTISLIGLEQGIYFLTLSSKGQTVTKKIIKQ